MVDITFDCITPSAGVAVAICGEPSPYPLTTLNVCCGLAMEMDSEVPGYYTLSLNADLARSGCVASESVNAFELTLGIP